MNISNRIAHYLVGSFSPRRPIILRNPQSMTMQQTVKINDVSFYQDNNATARKIDFIQMRLNGAKGVIIRGGQGSWNDEDFIDYYAAAKGVFPRGVYWFLDSRYTPTSQAAKLATLLSSYGIPDMEIWADFEDTYNGPYTGWRHLSVFIMELERLLPKVKVGIYTGYWYWIDHSPNPVTESASFAWFKKYPLWLAAYTADPVTVKVPLPWDSVLLWQYTSHGDGAKSGVESLNIDESYFNGSLSDFNLRYGATAPIPPEPPTGTPVIKLEKITPQPTLQTTVTVSVDTIPYTLTYTPPIVVPEPPVVTPDFPHKYLILDDIAGGREVRHGLPSTIRYRGGKGTVNLLNYPEWLKYIYAIQGNPNYQFISRYTFAPRIGWSNAGGYVVEQVDFSGNIVEVTRIEGTKHFIKSVCITDPIPRDKDGAIIYVRPYPFKDQGTHPLIHNFSIQYHDHLDLTTDGKYARTIVFSNIDPATGKPEELYIDSSEYKLKRL